MAGFGNWFNNQPVPTQGPPDLDALQADLERKRKMAELLQAQAFKGVQFANPQATGSWLNALAPILQYYAGEKEAGKLGEEEQNLGKQRKAQLEALLAARPKEREEGAIPAMDMGPQEPEGLTRQQPPQQPPAMPQQQPFGPQASPLATGMMQPPPPAAPTIMPEEVPPPDMMPKPAYPTNPDTEANRARIDVPGAMSPQERQAGKMVQPTMDERLDWVTRLGAEGGKQGQKIADIMLPQILKETDPTKGLMVVGGDIYDPRTGKFTTGPTTIAKNYETAIKNAELTQDREIRRAEIERANRMKETETERWHDMTYALKQGRGGGGEPGNIVDTGRIDAEGNQVVRNSKTGKQMKYDTTGELVSHTGETFNAAEQKDVRAARQALTEANQLDNTAKQVEAADPKAFGPHMVIPTKLNSATGGAYEGALGELKPEDRALRGVIGRDFAETTKRLYGANFTQAEQERANAFVPQPGETREVVAMKIRNAAKFAREMAEKYGPKAARGAAASGAGAGAGAPPKAGWKVERAD